MKLKGLFASIIALSLIAIPTANASGRYITVNAEGTIKVVPDAVRVLAQVSVVDGTNSGALAKANSSSSAVRKALTSNGIATKDIEIGRAHV